MTMMQMLLMATSSLTPLPDAYLDLNFASNSYRLADTASSFDAAFVGSSPKLTYAATSNSTMVNSSGNIVWAPHNLALNSAAPATQTITVVSGADYTVRVTGTGSMALSGAGTGTATAGSPATITATSTSLTITLTGSLDTVAVYRSDLGGMAQVPGAATGFEYYVPTSGAVEYLPRVGHHVYNGSAWVNEGLLIESEARTNLLLSTATLSTQSVTVTAVPHTLSFTGSGTVTLSGVSTDGPLVGTGTGENNRVNLTFTPTAGTLTLAVYGTVSNAQLEVGSTPSSYMPTVGGTYTRTAQSLEVPPAEFGWNSNAVSIQMDGRITYADEGTSTQAMFYRWYVSGSDRIQARFYTNTGTGGLNVSQTATSGGSASSAINNVYTPGVYVPFNIASRHGSTFVNGAVDGVALTAKTTTTALPDLSSTNLQIAQDFMGTIGHFRQWDEDIGDTGIEGATS